MNQPPNRKWAYAILERIKAGDKTVSPAAKEIAMRAVQVDRLEYRNEVKPVSEAVEQAA